MAKQAVLITGAAKRLGAAQAEALAKAGFDVAIHYHQSQADAKSLQKKLRALGVQSEIFKADLRDVGALDALIKGVTKTFPHLSLLVHNASIFGRAEFQKTNPAMFDEHIAVNLRAPFFLTQSFAKHIKHGQVITLLDAHMHRQDGTHFAYLLTKKALADFTLMAARNLAPHIRVNGVAVGITEISDDISPAFRTRKQKELLLGRLVSPEEVADAVRLLAENNSLTGQILYIDSGERLL